jgi:hypothetical protein
MLLELRITAEDSGLATFGTSYKEKTGISTGFLFVAPQTGLEPVTL